MTKISLLPAGTDADGTEQVPVVQGGTTVRIPALFSKADHDKLDGVEAGADVTAISNIVAAGFQPRVYWDSVTDTWNARPSPAIAPRVTFDSLDDAAATAPTDINLQIGDGWDYAVAP